MMAFVGYRYNARDAWIVLEVRRIRRCCAALNGP